MLSRSLWLSLSLIAGVAHAAPDCAAFNDSIQSELKDISLRTIEGLLDDSAPRAQMRAAQNLESLAFIQVNLTLAIRAGCPVPASPLDSTLYFGPATECATAKTSDDRKRLCERSTWKPLKSPTKP